MNDVQFLRALRIQPFVLPVVESEKPAVSEKQHAALRKSFDTSQEALEQEQADKEAWRRIAFALGAVMLLGVILSIVETVR